MNNSTFVKAMDNLRERINVRLVNSAADYQKYGKKQSFVSQKIFSKNFVDIHEINPVLTLDKLIYVGFSVLHLSKLLIYKFHYGYVKRKFSADLSFGDTKSSL